MDTAPSKLPQMRECGLDGLEVFAECKSHIMVLRPDLFGVLIENAGGYDRDFFMLGEPQGEIHVGALRDVAIVGDDKIGPLRLSEFKP